MFTSSAGTIGARATGRGRRTAVRRALSGLLAAGALVGTAAGTATAAPAAVPAAPAAPAAVTLASALAAPDTDLATQKRQVVAGINAERAAHGLAPLAEFGDVSAVSQRWAEAQAASGSYRHNPEFSAQLNGYAGKGEIIHLSYQTRNDGNWAVRGWIGSAPHHAVMLGDFTGMGVGIAVGPARVPNAQTEVYYVVNTVKGTRPTTSTVSAPATGTWTNHGVTHRLQGSILARYQAAGGPGSVLGLPTTSELSTPDGVGRYTHFDGGSVYWTPSTGAQVVRGAIRGTWSALGWENSAVGYPAGEEFAVRDGGRVQRFARGLVYWTPKLGAHEVHGAFGATYAAQGWERGSLGYPRTGEHAVEGGVRQEFQGGTLTWNRATGRVTRS
ncbi:CAP domain-containing protein [Kineococcus sp. TRM81007]|uniref:CAP domain-containing protein n=1 Tax=Kineococcus sp. TRM81007 TaxID=2925831 RepID=UPI001F5A16D7|nr:CAP domain-containing protein [Kineococcus sp. TRM81007]MCI2238311.1 CAP domain-containing protein [Kineococcus sp. TRM81007]